MTFAEGNNVTDQELLKGLIDDFGSQSELAHAMTLATREDVTTKRISNWHERGIPARMRWPMCRIAVGRMYLTEDQMNEFMGQGKNDS